MRGIRRHAAGLKGRILLATAAFLLAVGGVAVPAQAAETTTLTARYIITLAGLTIGRAEAEARFTGNGYAAAISGSTFGLSRFVSNAEAFLVGNGALKGTKVLPVTYRLDTKESDIDTQVRMEMNGGTITDLLAFPRLVDAPDRVPLNAGHVRGIVDPVGAFIVVRDWQGPVGSKRACDRTVRVFDGWQRYDVELFFKSEKYVSGDAPSYGGEVAVCGARYVPVAGHRPGRAQVQYMAENKHLEVWLAPIKGTPLLIPFRVVIGTKVGDLVINAQKFVSNATDERASAQ